MDCVVPLKIKPKALFAKPWIKGKSNYYTLLSLKSTIKLPFLQCLGKGLPHEITAPAVLR